MSWLEVPAKLVAYANEPYAPDDAITQLFRAYGVPRNSPADVPENMREEFEARLDYRLGACINLRTSRAIDPKRLTG